MLLPALLIHNMPNSSIVFGVSHVVILYLHIPGILETILNETIEWLKQKKTYNCHKRRKST